MRKSLAIAAIAFAAISTSACTPEEIAAVVEWHASQTEVGEPEPVAPSVEATVDCSTFTFTVSGYPEGTAVMIGIGSQPPFGFTVGGNEMWGFTPLDGGASGTIAISGYDSVHSFNWSVNIDTAPAAGSTAQRVAEGTTICP